MKQNAIYCGSNHIFAHGGRVLYFIGELVLTHRMYNVMIALVGTTLFKVHIKQKQIITHIM